MSSFLLPNETDVEDEIDIDELYQKNHERDLKQLSIFNKILNRIHQRIKVVSRQKCAQKFIWYNVPEYIFGQPLYDKGECIGYVMMKLSDNGFHVKYTHPSMLFVSWSKWVPSYVREQVKEKTGGTITSRGDVVEEVAEEVVEEEKPEPTTRGRKGKDYRSTDKYKPTGSLVYGDEMMEQLEKTVRFNL